MNYPVWQVPAPGLLIAAVGILHVFISHFAVGGGLFLVVGERKARREGDLALLGFVRALSRGFALLTLVLGALTGVGLWFTIGLVQPQATSALVITFLWAWAIEWTFFATEVAAALVYTHGWDRLPARTHLAVGWIYFASALASLVVITGILSFMLTSGAWPATHGFADGFFNPTYGPMVALRTAGAVGLAGLYVLFAGAFLRDPGTKERIARWTATRWIAPAAVAVPIAFVWFLSAAEHAGVAVAETLGAPSSSPLALLQAVFGAPIAGQPIVRGAARATLVATALLVVTSLLIAAFRPGRYGPRSASFLMLLGLVSIGGAEWLREGLRKPWVIDRYLFVNGVRVPSSPGAVGPSDPFALDRLNSGGVLAASMWHAAPSAFRPGDPSFEGLPSPERAHLAAEAGRRIFAIECAACHTERGHLGIRGLAKGKGVVGIAAVLDAAARPLGPEGRPAAWSDPQVRVATWLGRRMPPFAGTDAEKLAVAIHVARLAGDERAGIDESPAVEEGQDVFGRHCAACHGPGGPWPIGPRLLGRSEAELFEVIGRLPELRPEMPPFTGTLEERRTLAHYLGARVAAERRAAEGQLAARREEKR